LGCCAEKYRRAQTASLTSSRLSPRFRRTDDRRVRRRRIGRFLSSFPRACLSALDLSPFLPEIHLATNSSPIRVVPESTPDHFGNHQNLLPRPRGASCVPALPL